MDSMKLLLVDDNARIRKMMRGIYSPHFNEVIECDDGDKAVEEFNKKLPDWVDKMATAAPILILSLMFFAVCGLFAALIRE